MPNGEGGVLDEADRYNKAEAAAEYHKASLTVTGCRTARGSAES